MALLDACVRERACGQTLLGTRGSVSPVCVGAA